MLISHTHSFAFVHVPKTAGSSVHVALGRHATCVDDYWANRALARIGIPVNRFAPWPYTKLRPHAWDLLVSYWHYLRDSPGHHRGHIARRLPDFAAYVEYEIRRGQFSQSSLLCDRRGRLLVDFVGRYESLPTDFGFICRRIGIEATLPRVNAGKRGDYRDYYTPALTARVAEAFASDVERFGYAFDGAEPAGVPRAA